VAEGFEQWEQEGLRFAFLVALEFGGGILRTGEKRAPVNSSPERLEHGCCAVNSRPVPGGQEGSSPPSSQAPPRRLKTELFLCNASVLDGRGAHSVRAAAGEYPTGRPYLSPLRQ